MAGKGSAKKTTSGDKKKNVTFTIAVLLLSLAVLGSIVIFVISTLLNGKSSGEFTKSLYPVKYEYYVEGYAKEFDVDVCLVYGVIRTESSFNPNAVSQAGAIGLMQIMPDTFTWLQNYRADFMPDKLMDSSELYKPQVNIEYGTYMLHYLLKHYDGNISLAIIAYNAGYGNVDSWLANGTIPKDGLTSESIPFTETANYLDRVTESMNMYRKLYYDEINYYSDSDASWQEDETEEIYSEDEDYSPEADSEQDIDEYTDEEYEDSVEDTEYTSESGYDDYGEDYGYDYSEEW